MAVDSESQMESSTTTPDATNKGNLSISNFLGWIYSMCILKILHCVTIGVHTVDASKCENDIESGFPTINLNIKSNDEQPAPQTEQGTSCTVTMVILTQSGSDRQNCNAM